MRIRRDTYDLTGAAITKEIVHGITSLNATRAAAADLARLTQGQWGIESVHWLRHRLRRRPEHRLRGEWPQVMATLRNMVISLLHLAGITEITRTIQRITRDRTRACYSSPYETQVIKRLCRPRDGPGSVLYLHRRLGVP